MSDIHRTIEAVWKIESTRLIAGIARVTRDIGIAEELAQDALIAALEQWPEQGIPENPAAWLMTAAKRRAIDNLRRGRMLELKHGEITRDLSVFLLEHATAAQLVDGAALGCGHEPGCGIFRDALFGPLLEGRNERVLSEFFSDADVASDAGDSGDEACGLDLPHGLNRPVNVAHARAAASFLSPS